MLRSIAFQALLHSALIQLFVAPAATSAINATIKKERPKLGAMLFKAPTTTPKIITSVKTPEERLKFVDFVSNILQNETATTLERHFLELKNDPTPECSTFNTNSAKNRFPNIKCLESTRVRLNGSSATPESNDYIHANWVKLNDQNKFILTQFPKKNTNNDFWQMVWETEAEMIIAISNHRMGEDFTQIETYYMYENDVGQNQTFGQINVFKKNETQIGNIYTTIFEIERVVELRKTVKKLKSHSRVVKHIHITGWSDQFIPQNINDILNVLELMKSETKPIIVHCWAGIGRSGSLVALSIAASEFAAGKNVSVVETVNNLRKERDGVVQNKEQMVFIYFALLKKAEKDGFINDRKGLIRVEKSYSQLFK